MMDTILIVAVVLFGVLVGFTVPVLLEVKRTTRETATFLKKTEENLAPVLEDLDETLKNLKQITDDVTTVTTDVRGLSASATDLAGEIQGIARMARGAAEEVNIRVSSVSAAVGATTEAFRKILSR